MKKILKRYWLTALLSFVLMFFSYIVSNIGFSLFGEYEVLKGVRAFQSLFESEDYNVPDSILLINVSNDRELVKVKRNGIKVGDTDITNREKLLQLLRWLKETNNYRYILMDLEFDKNYTTDYDDSIYSLIDSMHNIGIVRTSEYDQMDDRIKKKAFWANYDINFWNSDLVKYPVIENDTASIALHAYEELTGRTLKRFGPFYFDGFHLARRCIYPKMYITEPEDGIVQKEGEEDGYQKEDYWCYNLGFDILESNTISEAKILFDKKIIVIGEFDKAIDRHNTYAGEQPGALVVLNVFISLMHHSHHIPLLLLVFLFAVFFILVDYLLHYNEDRSALSLGEAWLGWNKKTIKRSIIPLALLWTYYSIMLTVICSITFLVSGEAYDIFFTSTLLSIMAWIVRIIKRK